MKKKIFLFYVCALAYMLATITVSGKDPNKKLKLNTWNKVKQKKLPIGYLDSANVHWQFKRDGVVSQKRHLKQLHIYDEKLAHKINRDEKEVLILKRTQALDHYSFDDEDSSSTYIDHDTSINHSFIKLANTEHIKDSAELLYVSLLELGLKPSDTLTFEHVMNAGKKLGLKPVNMVMALSLAKCGSALGDMGDWFFTDQVYNYFCIIMFKDAHKNKNIFHYNYNGEQFGMDVIVLQANTTIYKYKSVPEHQGDCCDFDRFIFQRG